MTQKILLLVVTILLAAMRINRVFYMAAGSLKWLPADAAYIVRNFTFGGAFVPPVMPAPEALRHWHRR